MDNYNNQAIDIIIMSYLSFSVLCYPYQLDFSVKSHELPLYNPTCICSLLGLGPN